MLGKINSNMDYFFSGRKLYIGAAVLAGLGCVFMVCFPEVAVLAGQKGIAIFVGSVMPALLPFFIFSNFLASLGVTSVFSPSVFAFCMSIMSGYPMGAKVIGDYYKKGIVGEKEALRLLSFCSTTGPAFLIGTVGYTMLGSKAAGIILAVSHYGGSIVNGVVCAAAIRIYYRFYCDSRNCRDIRGLRNIRNSRNSRDSRDSQIDIRTDVYRQNSVFNIFTDSILSAMRSMGIIFAYIVIFMFVTDLIDFLGIINFIKSDDAKAVIKGIIEMTVGASSISGIGNAGGDYGVIMSIEEKIVALAGIISFGGLSVAGQSMSMLAGTGISLWQYIIIKLGHALWAMFIAIMILFNFPYLPT